MKGFQRVANSLLLVLSMNILVVGQSFGLSPVLQAVVFLPALACIVLINIVPCRISNGSSRLRSLKTGYELIVLFSITFLVNTAANIVFGIVLVPERIKLWILVSSTSCSV
jgi:hypothetical protein